MQQAEKSFELKVRRHLASYLRQAVQLFNSSGMTSGPDAEEVDRASSLFLSQVDRAYGDELAEFQHDVSSAYQTPLELGAAMAVKDLPSGYRFQENALLEVDWSLTNPDVVDWASQHSSTLVTNVLETSRQRIRAQLRAGILAGESRDQIAERLQGVLDDVPAWRARLIAQTEVIAAHTEGALSLYRKAEVVQGKRWVDGQPNACPLCSDLNGDVVGLDELFDGEFDGPPRHPGCRCTVAATLTAPEPKDIEYERQLAKVLNSDPGFIRFLDSLNYNAEQKRQAIMSYGKPSPPQISGDLTEAQQAAVDFYSREGYLGINTALESGTGEYAKEIRSIDAAIKKGRVPKETPLYRGAYGASSSDYHVGQIIRSPSYTSTSLDRDVAADFAKLPNGVMFEYKLPNGAPAVVGTGETGMESEVILARNSAFQVTKIDGDVITLLYLGP